MLYINISDIRTMLDSTRKSVILHVNADRAWVSRIPVEDVISVEADGHELDMCLKITGLPNLGRRSQRFYGDFAKHIVGNWV
jgi:hypothetical protein